MSDDLFERRLRDFLRASPNPDEPASLHLFLAQVPAAHPHVVKPRRAQFAAIAAALIASFAMAALLGVLLLRGVAAPSPSASPTASTGPSGAVPTGPSIGTAVKLGDHAGTGVSIAATATGALVAVTPGETDANGSRSCPAGVLGSIANDTLVWTDAPAAVQALAGASGAFGVPGSLGVMGLGSSADCSKTMVVLPDGTTGFTAQPVNDHQLSPAPALLATKPADQTSVTAWQPDPLKGGFVFWSSDSGLTWNAETSMRPAGWDAAGRFWSMAAAISGGSLELANSPGPGYASTRTGILVNAASASITGTAVFRDRILIARSNAPVLSVSTSGGGTSSLNLMATSIAAGPRFVAAVGHDLASGRAELAISTDGVQFIVAPLSGELAGSDPGLLRLAALGDRVILTAGPSGGPISIWSTPITDIPAAPPSPSQIPTPAIPTQPPAQLTSTWTKVTLPTIVTQPLTVGGPGGGPSALPGGGFIDFVPTAPTRTVVLTSPDGSAWTQVGEITGPDALGATGPVAFNGHVYVALGGEGGGGFYGMQSNGAAWVSTDLAHWTKAPAQGGLGGAIFRGIAAGSANFVAIGDSEGGGPTVWTSPDGLHWGPVLVKSVFPFDLSEATGIAQTTNGLVIVGRIGEEGATWTSPDGRTWTVHSPLPAGSGIFNGLANGPAGFVSLVSGSSAGIEVAPGDFRAPVTPWTSADGITWHAGPPSPALFGAYASIVGAPGGYLAVGTVGLDATNHLWSSTNGTNWVPVARVDLGSAITPHLVSDGRHVLIAINGPSGQQFLVSDGIHG